jgi:hypothetical protein
MLLLLTSNVFHYLHLPVQMKFARMSLVVFVVVAAAVCFSGEDCWLSIKQDGSKTRPRAPVGWLRSLEHRGRRPQGRDGRRLVSDWPVCVLPSRPDLVRKNSVCWAADFVRYDRNGDAVVLLLLLFRWFQVFLCVCVCVRVCDSLLLTGWQR